MELRAKERLTLLPPKWWTGVLASMAICRLSVRFKSVRLETYVFKLGLAEGRAVGSDEDELGLARADGLHGGLGTHGD